MSKPDRFDSVVAEVPPAVSVSPAATEKAAAKLQLDGDEIIQFATRPSGWLIAFVSGKWVLAMGLLAAAIAVAMRGGWSWQGQLAFQVTLGVAALRVGIATLQWASKLYVLTNRRVMRFRGVFKPEMAQCPLSKISKVDLQIDWSQRALGLGSIDCIPEKADAEIVQWQHLAQVATVHDRLLRAIRKAQSSD
jgi:hypothetical protein